MKNGFKYFDLDLGWQNPIGLDPLSSLISVHVEHVTCILIFFSRSLRICLDGLKLSVIPLTSISTYTFAKLNIY